jgi:hypothetical protein
MKQEIKVGDHVHVGHMVKGGAGARGIVTKIGDDGSIIFKSHEDKRQFRGRIQNATLEKEVAARNESSDACSVCGQTPCNCTHIEETALDESMADSWKKVQSMDKGSITGGKEEVKKRLSYLNAVHAHHKKYGNDTLKVKKEIEAINRSHVAEEVESVTEGRGAYDELAGRMGTSSPGFNKTPAGKAREQKRRQEHLKGQMQFTKRMGGLTGPKSNLPEDVELDEAVEVSHDRYMRSHGKKASGGNGNWMFTHKRAGDVDYNNKTEVHSARGTYSDAKKSAQKWAKEHGHRTVYVMESTEQQGMLTFKELLEALKGKQHNFCVKKNMKKVRQKVLT